MSVQLSDIWSNIYRQLPEMGDNEKRHLQNVLYAELGKYIIEKQTSTELVVYDNDVNVYNLFFASKEIEGLSKRTLKCYKDTINEFLKMIPKKILDMSTNDVRYYLAIKKTRDKVSQVTIENNRRNLSSFYGWLSDEGYMEKNIVKPIKKVKVAKIQKKAFDETEVEKLKDASLRLNKEIERLRAIALIEFLLSTGCRVGEVSTAKLVDYDADKRSCKVLGKGNKERSVYLNKASNLRLQEYLRCREKRYGKCEWLFASNVRIGGSCRQLAISGIEILMRKLGKMAKVKNCHPHRFRRTCATWALKKGMSLIEVSKMLGHENLDTTKIYLEFNEEELQFHHNKYM
ncbi:MAG: tyrosine-type recombinase/integrase [bacterium]|nr:tyrosine-type recombinase/integrase [bacterium]